MKNFRVRVIPGPDARSLSSWHTDRRQLVELSPPLSTSWFLSQLTQLRDVLGNATQATVYLASAYQGSE